MPREKDPFWKYVTLLNENNSKWRCSFCGQEYRGGATRIKAHLAGIAGFGIKGCETVDADVKADAREVLMPKKVMDSSDQGVSEERIRGNFRAAPISTLHPPNVEGATNLQFPQGESTSWSTEAAGEEVSCLVASPHQPQCSFLSPYPVGASSFQDDQLPSIGNSNCLQDCNQHSQLQTPMDIDPSIASQHTSDPHIIEATIDDSQVPKAATVTTCPSSSQELDMDEGAPMTSHPNTGNNFEALDAQGKDLPRRCS